MFIADIRRCDLNDLFYFAMVVEHGGFSQAGRALAMPKSSSAAASPCWRSGWVSA